MKGGTVAAAPPPFRPSEPALCVFIVRLLCFSVIDVLYVSLQYFAVMGKSQIPISP